MVGDVNQTQRWRTRVFRQGHVRAQLRQHQAGGHAPLRVSGMAVGEKFHRFDVVLVFLAAVFFAGAFDSPLADFVRVAAGFALDAAAALDDVLAALGAPACCCAVCAMSVIALWAMC